MKYVQFYLIHVDFDFVFLGRHIEQAMCDCGICVHATARALTFHTERVRIHGLVALIAVIQASTALV